MKKIILALLLSFASVWAFANHIVGGEVFYQYAGPGSQNNSSRYVVSLRLFTTCGQVCGGTSGVACPPANPIIGIFINSSPYTRVQNITLSKIGEPQISLSTFPSCITNPPVVCYQVNSYSTVVELPNNSVGYRFSYQNCCRATALNVPNTNANSSSGQHGAAYEATMPGTNLLGTGTNSTAVVRLKDTALICFNSAFNLEFSADDMDGDSLSYLFVAAYDGGSFTGGQDDKEPDLPLYRSIPYTSPFAGGAPLGSTVSINPQTGLISGIAPATTGLYVVNVRISEWRNGVRIADHGKDFLIRVNDCQLPNAELDPSYITCDGFDFTFTNKTPSSAISTYFWDFGDGNTSTAEIPTHVYSDTGTYRIKLVVNRNLPCSDSAEALLRVYPGFFPEFAAIGQCKNTPITLNDRTTVRYGFVNSWRWNFDDPSSGANDSSRLRNPTHIFATARTYNVRLTVTSNLGCSATITRPVLITDFPAFVVAPRDTLICDVDTVRLSVTGTGTALWSPNYNIDDVTSLTPLVGPDVTTTYRVRFTDPFGCFGFDSLRVRVVRDVTQGRNYDSTMCLGDTARLSLVSDALYFTWLPNDGSLNNTTIKNPLAVPTTTTTYRVRGRISNICFADNEITLRPVAPPRAQARDTSVCFGRNTQLFASGGSMYVWSPPDYLSNTTVPDPLVINPLVSTNYTVGVSDTLGCTKTIFQTVRLNVIRVNAQINAADTAVVIGQPLQLLATGGNSYNWLPDNRWLSSTVIPNPISNPLDNIRYSVLVTDTNGCEGRASINVRLFKVVQGLYVPNAFTPNGDGLNDLFRPIPLGITVITRFSVYNRLGELVYQANGSEAARGWNGTFKGKPQDGGNYVWYAEATDYLNKQIKRKGNVVLIR